MSNDRIERAAQRVADAEKKTAELDNVLQLLAEASRIMGSRMDRALATPITPPGSRTVLRDERIDCGGFDASVAARVGVYALPVLDAVESVLQRKGWDRTDTALRRQALALALADNPRLAGALSDFDREAIVSGYAENPAVDRHESIIPTTPPGTYGGAQTGELGGLKPRVAAGEGIYGTAAKMAEELGGVLGYGEGTARYRMLQAILQKHGLRLTKSDERRRAMTLLHERVNPTGTLAKAATFAEAEFCVARARKLSFAEQVSQAGDIAKVIAKQRPDLADSDYGRAGRDQQRPSPRREGDEAAMHLTEEAARAYLRDIDAPQTEANLYRARVAIARKLKGPKYGRGSE